MGRSIHETQGLDKKLAYAEGPEYTLPVECFKDIYESVLVQHGDRPALVSMEQRDDSHFAGGPKVDVAKDCIRLTFRELHQHASSLAATLYVHGLRPQQTFATFLPNSAEFSIALLAAAILNVSLVPLDPRSLTRPDEVQHSLGTIKPAALLVSDEQFAETVDRLADTEAYKSCLKILIHYASGITPGWLCLEELLRARLKQSTITPIEPEIKPVDVENDTALMIFTSGTSGLPKAYRLTCKNVACFVRIPEAIRQIKHQDRTLQPFAISHVAAIGQFLQTWAAGACVVIPSKNFDARATLHAIEREGCTRMTAVSSMIDQILSLPDFSPKKVQSLHSMFVGAAIISPEIIAKCRDSAGLGVRRVVPVYGMTEAVSVLTWHETDDLIIEHGFASVGRPFRDVKVKICSPESQEPCMIGDVGELHISTPGLTPGYLGQENGPFYHEGGCRWLATGDQARMHASGNVFILGRYKDVIIRGGENLSPAIIESCITARFPSIQVCKSDTDKSSLLTVLKVQVVGVDDKTAGEVPVAVVRCPNGFRPDATRVQKVVRERLGPASVPEKFLNLQDLDLESFPLTTSGKVQKQVLKKLVSLHFETTDILPLQSEPSNFSMKAAMLETMQDLLGCDSKDRSLEHQPLPRLLDSLSMMKFASALRRKHRVEVSMADMNLSQNLDDLVSRAKLNIRTTHLSADMTSNGPPEQGDLNYEEESGRTRSYAQPKLLELGLSWDADVQEVFPIVGTSVWHWMKDIPFRHKWTIDTLLSSYDEACQAVETSLSQWPVLRSIAVEYNEKVRLLVALRAHKPYFDLAISSLGQVKSRKALGDFDIPTLQQSGSFPEGLLFHVRVAKIAETGTFGLLVVANHAVYDEISINLWAEDLQQIMIGNTIAARTPFRLFVDAYYVYQDSAPAREARDYHKRQFEQNGADQKALWPAGDGLVAKFLVALRTASQKPVAPNDDASLGDCLPSGSGTGVLEQTLHCPNLLKPRCAQDLSPMIVTKMAISLFNSWMTDRPHAILVMLMAGRIWPFMSSSIAEHLPSSYDIAGPTLTGGIDVIGIDRREEVGQLYTRMEEQQKASSHYQHVPQSMMPQLNQDSHGMRTEAVRQVFNWIPSRNGKEANAPSGLHAVDVPGQDNIPPAGVAWTGRLVNSETINIQLRWNSRHLSEEEGAKVVERVVRLVEWICEPDNWHEQVEKVYQKIAADVDDS